MTRQVHELSFKESHADGSTDWECGLCGLVVKPQKEGPPVVVQIPEDFDPEVDHVYIRNWLGPFQNWIEKLP